MDFAAVTAGCMNSAGQDSQAVRMDFAAVTAGCMNSAGQDLQAVRMDFAAVTAGCMGSADLKEEIHYYSNCLKNFPKIHYFPSG